MDKILSLRDQAKKRMKISINMNDKVSDPYEFEGFHCKEVTHFEAFGKFSYIRTSTFGERWMMVNVEPKKMKKMLERYNQVFCNGTRRLS